MPHKCFAYNCYISHTMQIAGYVETTGLSFEPIAISGMCE